MTDQPEPSPAETEQLSVVALCTLQFSWGGMFDSEPADDYMVHLVRETKRGTPGPTLCGIDRFADDAPGWSVAGGVSGPDIKHKPCPGCAETARSDFPGLPVAGIGAKEMSAVLGVGWRHGRSGPFLNVRPQGD